MAPKRARGIAPIMRASTLVPVPKYCPRDTSGRYTARRHTGNMESKTAARIDMQTACNASAGQLVVVIDDDPMVLDGMRGLLRSWGYRVVAAASDSAALADLAEQNQRPDLIISDYRLGGGKTGIEAIERLRHVFPIPACLITGETAPEGLLAARASGYLLLYKPVPPTALRATLSQLLKN
jgi:two-component system, sensor histidine kinase